jgi:uncharacterized protein (TIGR02687 family)
MTTEQSRIEQSLQRLFRDDGQRIVFWHDPDREFEALLSELTLDDITLLRLDEQAVLAVKLRLEREDPVGRYLLYAPFDPPPPADDWLLDMRLYSGSFRADRASIWLSDLGLAQPSLRGHLAKRAKFFAGRDRLERLRKRVAADDREVDIDRKIAAVLAGSDQADLFSVLISLYDDIPNADPDAPPAAWADIGKYGVEGTFWDLIEGRFGYREDPPSLSNLLLRLLVSDLARHCGATLPDGLRHLVLPRHGGANAVVCLAQWRDSSTRGRSYEVLSARVADTLGLDQQLGALSVEDLAAVPTFLLVEKFIASRLRDRVLETRDSVKPDSVRELASRRQDGFWASPSLRDGAHAPRKALHAVYEALQLAAGLFDLRNRTVIGSGDVVGVAGGDAKGLIDAYTAELWRFDQYYRLFCESADFAERRGWDILKSLRAEVEAVYGNGYLADLALRWNGCLEAGLLDTWRIPGVPNQQAFFKREVGAILDQGGDRRVFVVISDAFRYEAAAELTAQLDGRYRFTAELSPQLGVLPSYTGLGMAALLPHKDLVYTDNGTLKVDGLSCGSLGQRSRVLDAVQGVAIKAETLMAMKQAEARAFVKPYRVVYLYHNQVDAVGDSASTEDHSFDAVRTAIDELADLVGRIINSVNGYHILVTADHGFLFQETPPGETDKNALASKPEGTVLAKKRYLLGRNLPEHPKAFHGATAITAGAAGDMEFWVPKGTNRFHFIGGSRFVHGGAMPQEVVVPVIRVHHVKEGRKAKQTQTRSVRVSVLGTNFKLTTHRQRFQLMQTEPVGGRVKPVTLKIAIYDGGTAVTNVETVSFDTPSNDMNDWKKAVSLTLEGRRYDRKRQYTLILRDADTGVEQARHDITIDLAFGNDF